MQRQLSGEGRGIILENYQVAGVADIEGVPIPINREPAGAGSFPQDREPAARPGDVLYLVPSGRVFAVVGMEPQLGVIAFDANGNNELDVSAKSTSDKQEIDQIKQDDGWLGQLRLMDTPTTIPSGVRVTVDFGGEQAVYSTTNNQRGFFVQDTVDLFDNVLELYILEQEEVFLTFENTTGAQVTVQDLTWSGYQYELTELAGLPDNVRPLVLPTQSLD